MAEKRPLEDARNLDDEGGSGSGKLSGRVTRTLGMTDEEWAARERRRIRFLAHRQQWSEEQGGTKETSNNTPELIGGHTETTVEAGVSEPSQPPVVEADSQKRKPWESLVIGNLGENLSHIERKNREIEQQRFIVHHHEENSKYQVRHNRRILNRLVAERNNMEDNEENNMPQDQREKEERISSRLDLLKWALDSSQCDDESVNIKAAIQGYESGEIPYSCDFTLIYAGHIVDRCQTYNSFCVDRSERLDRYFENYGPGWLWHEPPLASSGADVLGKKGICLERNAPSSTFGIGHYNINLEFAVRRGRVSRGRSKVYPLTTLTTGREATKKSRRRDASCQLETLLDSGATFPLILESDLARLNMNLKKYPAQGTMTLNTVGGRSKLKFYEMYVSVCSDEGKSLVGEAKEAVWPKEPRTLGGFCPVLAMRDGTGGDRLSGMIPFDACYISSAPSMRRLWLGEDRRDVLGTSRLPAHLRFDSDKRFIFQHPREFEDLRLAARTPDRVVFLHQFPDKPDTLLTDSDTLGTRGSSELAIGHYESKPSSSGKRLPKRAEPQRVIQIEPRKGGVKIVPNLDSRLWKEQFNP
ncbi:hypothetical protein F4801DRAFT_339835 [Xylaria longipes]|nr:hypothetical protein F4801DRAFT_339835 [Xylaria longipes]RYC56989.1 hypothetical protein CHU98_g9228 [Xylaria longipes]